MIVLRYFPDSIILRPTLMFGWFDRKHLGWLSNLMVSFPLFPIPGKGQFIRHANAGVVVGRYTQQPSKIVGFKVNESIVTSNTDTTLLDPAQGADNYTAPGANRLKLTTELSTLDFNSAGDPPTSNNFFSLVKALIVLFLYFFFKKLHIRLLFIFFLLSSPAE